MTAPRLLVLAAAGLLAFTAAHGRAGSADGQPKEPPKSDSFPLPDESEVMKAKLRYYNALLTALLTEDYKSLERNADVLVRISQMRVFVASYGSEEYKFQAVSFKKASEKLLAYAQAKNVDGATLAYGDMTRSCVLCHQAFRKEKK